MKKKEWHWEENGSLIDGEQTEAAKMSTTLRHQQAPMVTTRLIVTIKGRICA